MTRFNLWSITLTQTDLPVPSSATYRFYLFPTASQSILFYQNPKSKHIQLSKSFQKSCLCVNVFPLTMFKPNHPLLLCCTESEISRNSHTVLLRLKLLFSFNCQSKREAHRSTYILHVSRKQFPPCICFVNKIAGKHRK